MLRKKHESRLDDEAVKTLASYRAEELERMRINFFGADPAYHEARRRFVFKGNPPPPRETRAPILIKHEGPQAVRADGAPRPMPQDVNWSALSPGVNGSAHAPRLEAGESPAVFGETLGVRVLTMLRRAITAIPVRRDQ